VAAALRSWKAPGINDREKTAKAPIGNSIVWGKLAGVLFHFSIVIESRKSHSVPEHHHKTGKSATFAPGPEF
jgi:hypothetical protein